MTVALIITTYNWPEALRLVLLSAFSQTTIPTEIIIADDGSTSDTQNLIMQMRQNTHIPIMHYWQEDKGFMVASSRNGAIRRAKSEYLIMVDGDMILESHFIEDHLKFAKKNTFVQGGRVLLNKEKTDLILQQNRYKFSFFEKGIYNRKNILRSEYLSRILSKSSKTLKGIKTCNFALYKKDAYLVNGFNEAFVGWGREDSEFAARLMNAGIQRKDLKFKATAYHLYHHENIRKSLAKNDKLLQNTIDKKLKWCDKGLI